MAVIADLLIPIIAAIVSDVYFDSFFLVILKAEYLIDNKLITLPGWDGYPFLKPTLAASEASLAEQIANDPQNIHSFIATKGIVEGNKSFDDRTYIRFSVEK